MRIEEGAEEIALVALEDGTKYEEMWIVSDERGEMDALSAEGGVAVS